MSRLVKRKKYGQVFVTFLTCALLCSHCTQSNCRIPQDTLPPLYTIHGEEMNETFLANRYRIQGSIPFFRYQHNSDPVPFINELVNSFLLNEKSKWEQSVSTNLHDDGLPYDASLWIDFETHYLSKERSSIQMFFSIDLGGAHPHEYSKALNIDFTKKTIVNTKDLFLSQSDFLKSISTIARSKLPQKLQNNQSTVDREWILQGTEPILDNYQNVCITPNGLLVTFDPYQVASYGDGLQSIEIPFSDLRNIIAFKPNPSAGLSYPSTSQITCPSVSRTIVPSSCVVKM
ncbi:MAG: RsiV family protein [Caldisericia bacterium]|nr:RsiV family protein [Caldisericia bacterium]